MGMAHLKIKILVRELKKHRLDRVGGKDARCDDVGTEGAEDYTPSSGKGNENHYFLDFRKFYRQ